MRKRSTKKTGNFSKRTTTLSTVRGKTESTSTRPPGGATRRTVSFNHNTGKTRVTNSTRLGGGWTSIRSKTFTNFTRPRVSKRRGGNSDWKALSLVFMFAFAIIYGLIWCVCKYFQLLYRTAELSIKKPETESITSKMWYYTKTTLLTIGYFWLVIVIILLMKKLLMLLL